MPSADFIHARRSRLGLALALWAGLWLSACGGGGGSAPTELPPQAQSPISTAKSGEVLAYVKQKLETRGPSGGDVIYAADMPVWLATTTTSSGAVARTGTLVQESGVDEDDLIKTDGTHIYTLQPLPSDGPGAKAFARLEIHERDAAGRAQSVAQVMLSTATPAWTNTRGMLLEPDRKRAAVLGEGGIQPLFWPDCPIGNACINDLLPYRPLQAKLQVQLLDLSQPKAVPAPQRLEIDGRLVGSRLIGSTLYLVAVHAPSLAFDTLPFTASPAERKTALDRITLADVMPRISVDGAPSQALVNEADCWLQADNRSTQVAITTITAIDLGSPGYNRSSRCFVGGTEALYMSPGNVYLATSRHDVQTLDGRVVFAAEMRTDIHKFGIAGASIAYRGSGSVNGSLGWDRERASYRMSEHNGDLRVLSFTGSVGWFTEADAKRVEPSPATLTVLRENSASASLQTLATLPNARRPAPIGKPGEQVYAVRFLGERGYVVTFRRTDPLYVLDLSDPTDPRQMGELQMPGFSDWLYPLDGGLLFGVGKDADPQGRVQGVKLALFDVRDPTSPRLIDSLSYGGPGSASGLDFSSHGMGLQAVGSVTRLALPLQLMPKEVGLVQQQLQRLEVDTVARTLTAKAAIDFGNGWADLGSARSLLLGGQLYHLRDGKLGSWDW